ncbi:MAG: exonuclease SbcCD subunit D [Streptosporangiaceae bacterium]|jgi:DNA repair protein SbcD/Mre11
MRILHTSDWHLGRSLHRADLREAQARFADHLVSTVKEESIDAVLVAGDVYDRAVPPVDSVALFEETLARLRDVGARVVLISGNHDSARRLGVNSALIDAAGVHLRTRREILDTPVTLTDEHGEVAVYGVPYTEPAATDLPEHTHTAVFSDAVQRIRTDVARRDARRTIVMAHGWIAGGEPSESEREIAVGGVGQVPLSVFDGFSYVALGHLHGQQTLAEHLRYSGSPLPYSFSEANHNKGSWLAELDASGLTRVERVPAPVYRKLSVLRGPLDALLTEPEHDARENDFLSVTLTDTVRPEGAMDQLRTRFPHVLVLAFDPEGVVRDTRSYGQKTRGRTDVQVAAEFVSHVRGAPPSLNEERLLSSAFDSVRREGDAA